LLKKGLNPSVSHFFLSKLLFVCSMIMAPNMLVVAPASIALGVGLYFTANFGTGGAFLITLATIFTSFTGGLAIGGLTFNGVC